MSRSRHQQCSVGRGCPVCGDAGEARRDREDDAARADDREWLENAVEAYESGDGFPGVTGHLNDRKRHPACEISIVSSRVCPRYHTQSCENPTHYTHEEP